MSEDTKRIAELERLLNSEDDTPVEILPDGTIRQVGRVRPVHAAEGLVAEAIEHAERGASKLRFFDPTSKYASEEMYEAWDQLQAASETVRDAMHKLGFRDPRA